MLYVVFDILLKLQGIGEHIDSSYIFMEVEASISSDISVNRLDVPASESSAFFMRPQIMQLEYIS